MRVDVCIKTWEHQGIEGYVFLSMKEYDGTSNKQGKPNGVWTDEKFKFPQDKEDIVEWLEKQDRSGDRVDLYWCPNIFTSKRRLNGSMERSNVLYADLDFVNPKEVPYRPTVAWQSSPDRYQCLWFLDEELKGEEFEEVNKKMTYLTGADKSGWDKSQVLRVPDRYNHKTEPATEGKMLWAKYSRSYQVSDFAFDSAPAMSMDLKLTGSFFELVEKYKDKLDKAKICHKLQWTSERVKGCDRSDVLWAMTREMLKVNIPLEDIASLIQQSAWNKYSNRAPAEERKRIIRDIDKAHLSLIENEKPTEKQKQAIEEATSTEEDDLQRQAKIIMSSFKTYGQIMSSNKLRPNWLIEGIWVEGSQGIIAGEAKTFKSTLTTDMAMSVASGAPLWGRYKVNKQGPVLIVQVENNEDLVKNRMERMTKSKGVCGNVNVRNGKVKVGFGEELPIYTHIADKHHPSIKFSNPAHLLAVEMMVKKIKPALVIFDPLYQLFEGDMSSSQELAPALRWLKDLRINYNTSVMLVHHYNKGNKDNKGASAGHRLLGSVTLHGWVEGMIALEKGPTAGGITNLTMSREFRAMGASEPLHLALNMGSGGREDYSYEVSVQENSDLREAANVASNVSDNISQEECLPVLDLINQYPQGILITDLAKKLNVSKINARRLVTACGKCVEVVSGKGDTKKVKIASTTN